MSNYETLKNFNEIDQEINQRIKRFTEDVIDAMEQIQYDLKEQYYDWGSMEMEDALHECANKFSQIQQELNAAGQAWSKLEEEAFNLYS